MTLHLITVKFRLLPEYLNEITTHLKAGKMGKCADLPSKVKHLLNSQTVGYEVKCILPKDGTQIKKYLAMI